jgi:hypothetical protein
VLVTIRLATGPAFVAAIANCPRRASLRRNQGGTMLNQLTQTQKYAVYAFAAGVLTVIAFLLLAR